MVCKHRDIGFNMLRSSDHWLPHCPCADIVCIEWATCTRTEDLHVLVLAVERQEGGVECLGEKVDVRTLFILLFYV